MTPIERLRILISELAEAYGGTSLGNALNLWRDWLTRGMALRNLIVVEPSGSAEIITDYRDGRGIVEGLEWYQCPKCGLVFSTRGRDVSCPNCNSPAVPLYVGVPKPNAPIQPYIGGGQTKLISSAASNEGTYWLFNCPRQMRDGRRWVKSRGLKSADPNRPMMSLRLVCHIESVRSGRNHCPHYDPNNHYCNFGSGNQSSTYFNFRLPIRGVTMVPVRPSEELTKPFIVTIHSIKTDSNEQLLREFREIIRYPDLVEKIGFGDVELWELQLFYIVGPPTASKPNRVPVFYTNINNDQYRIPGRRLSTQGLYLKLNLDVLSQIAKELSDKANTRYDEFVVIHSLSHVLLNAVVNTAGVSEEEVSESIFFSRRDGIAEIVIYDNAQGGIDGVGAAVRNFPDLVRRLFYSAKECPRRCRNACRACLFSTSCTYANTKLSWYVANMLIDWSKKSVYSSLGS